MSEMHPDLMGATRLQPALQRAGIGGSRVLVKPFQRARQVGIAPQLSRELELDPTEIDISEPFAHYGLDSVHAIRLTAALAAWLGRELSPTLAYEYPTIELASRPLEIGRVGILR